MGKQGYGWKFRRKGLIVGKNGDPTKFWTPEEYSRLMRVSRQEYGEMSERAMLLRRGYQGDREALEELRTRYRLRLYSAEECHAETQRRRREEADLQCGSDLTV